MTLAAFHTLQPAQRIQLAVEKAIYLTHRSWLGGTLQLFFLPVSARGIFIELRYEVSLQAIILVNSFTETAALEPYLDRLSLLPNWG
jgi:hypothetical protein